MAVRPRQVSTQGGTEDEYDVARKVCSCTANSEPNPKVRLNKRCKKPIDLLCTHHGPRKHVILPPGAELWSDVRSVSKNVHRSGLGSCMGQNDGRNTFHQISQKDHPDLSKLDEIR